MSTPDQVWMQPHLGRKPIVIALVIAVALAIGAYHRWGGDHTESVDPATLASQINAYSCEDSGYRIKAADGPWTTVYNCDMGSKTICVSEQNNIPSNVTVQAKFAFADALGGSKPSCVG